MCASVNPLNYRLVLNTLTRDELRALSTHLGVQRGKNKEDSITNMVSAFTNGMAHVKTIVYISTPPTLESKAIDPYAKGNTLFIKEFRNYKTDKVIIHVPPMLVQ